MWIQFFLTWLLNVFGLSIGNSITDYMVNSMFNIVITNEMIEDVSEMAIAFPFMIKGAYFGIWQAGQHDIVGRWLTVLSAWFGTPFFTDSVAYYFNSTHTFLFNDFIFSLSGDWWVSVAEDFSSLNFGQPVARFSGLFLTACAVWSSLAVSLAWTFLIYDYCSSCQFMAQPRAALTNTILKICLGSALVINTTLWFFPFGMWQSKESAGILLLVGYLLLFIPIVSLMRAIVQIFFYLFRRTSVLRPAQFFRARYTWFLTLRTNRLIHDYSFFYEEQAGGKFKISSVSGNPTNTHKGWADFFKSGG